MVMVALDHVSGHRSPAVLWLLSFFFPGARSTIRRWRADEEAVGAFPFVPPTKRRGPLPVPGAGNPGAGWLPRVRQALSDGVEVH